MNGFLISKSLNIKPIIVLLRRHMLQLKKYLYLNNRIIINNLFLYRMKRRCTWYQHLPVWATKYWRKYRIMIFLAPRQDTLTHTWKMESISSTHSCYMLNHGKYSITLFTAGAPCLFSWNWRLSWQKPNTSGRQYP